MMYHKVIERKLFNQGGIMSKNIQKMEQGFTLVELSIVIIIVGFLIAGISAGQSLIKQAKLNAIISEVTNYRTAVNQFISIYDGFPGDFTKGYAYFGSLPNANCTDNTIGLDITGCNGDGNGSIFNYNNNDVWYPEGLLAWKHLSLAGLVPGNYIVNPSHFDTVVSGVNVPASKFDNAGYTFNDGLNPALGIWFEIGAERSADKPCTNIFTAIDAASIDTKADDGSAASGLVMANFVNGYPPAGGGWDDYCTNGTDYLISTPGVICRLAFTHLDNK
jgi:prepilin-type N-terminal cleavage/methylation domain-containing protein